MANGGTLYEAMLRAQAQQAERNWMQAENERLRSDSRQDAGFDKLSRVMDMVRQAQADEHKRNMDIAALAGKTGQELPARLAGKTSYAETAGVNRKAAEALARMKAAEEKRKFDREVDLEGIKGGINLDVRSAIEEHKQREAKKERERIEGLMGQPGFEGLFPGHFKQFATPGQMTASTALSQKRMLLSEMERRYAHTKDIINKAEQIQKGTIAGRISGVKEFEKHKATINRATADIKKRIASDTASRRDIDTYLSLMDKFDAQFTSPGRKVDVSPGAPLVSPSAAGDMSDEDAINALAESLED